MDKMRGKWERRRGERGGRGTSRIERIKLGGGGGGEKEGRSRGIGGLLNSHTHNTIQYSVLLSQAECTFYVRVFKFSLISNLTG